MAIAIKELFGWGIYEAKELIKNAPVILKENVPLYQAELMKIRLELAGGKVNISLKSLKLIKSNGILE